jgi:hypothetical protein
MSQELFNSLLRFFKALGNESRLKLIGLLANGERSVGELAALLDLKEPTVSHHLAQLRELGLVDVRPDKNTRIYSLNALALENMSRELFSQDTIAALVEDEGVDTQALKVLRAFVEDDQLKAIPAQDKKKLVILRWLVEKFDPDQTYHELELNAIIKRHHPDAAYLRRLLIVHGLMAREDNVYWRIDSAAAADG